MRSAQNIAGAVGVVLGVIPLIQYLVTGGIGLWSFVLGDAPATPWIYPLLVAVVAGIAIVVLERRIDAGTSGRR